MKAPAVYLLASAPRGTLYIGVRSKLSKRIWQHREGFADGFTKRYNIKMLVWFEQHRSMINAIEREKSIKKWSRLWKIELVESVNPEWRDLWDEIV